jgi:hypothetical protein
MLSVHDIDSNAPSRQLVRVLRNQPDRMANDDVMPESVLWRAYCELRRRDDPSAANHFIRSMRTLHRRRAMATSELSVTDNWPEEHKLVNDALLGELWKAYKRCIQAQRTGPAAQLLNDIAAQLGVA